MLELNQLEIFGTVKLQPPEPTFNICKIMKFHQRFFLYHQPYWEDNWKYGTVIVASAMNF